MSFHSKVGQTRTRQSRLNNLPLGCQTRAKLGHTGSKLCLIGLFKTFKLRWCDGAFLFADYTNHGVLRLVRQYIEFAESNLDNIHSYYPKWDKNLVISISVFSASKLGDQVFLKTALKVPDLSHLGPILNSHSSLLTSR